MNALEARATAEALRRLSENLAGVRAEVAAACARTGRDAAGVELLGVVKYVEHPAVRLLVQAGQLDLAENTLQGAERKAAGVRELEGPRWHLVGHLQRNKARKAVRLFSSIHSLDSERLARKLDEEIALLEEEGPAEPTRSRSPLLPSTRAPSPPAPPLPALFIEVNIAREPQKSGVDPEGAAPLLSALRRLPRVAARIAGLMAMAPHSPRPEAARPHFRRLREMRDRLLEEGLLPPPAGLSMGMSGDFPAAVEEGATVVRIGTRLFEGTGLLSISRDAGAARPEAPRCP